MNDPRTENATGRPRRTGLWTGGGIAAAILVLAVNGTLSSWTAAIIDNNHNDVAVGGAVALVETGPGPATCDTGPSVTNEVTCSTINKYGGTGSPLDPDGVSSQAVTVNLKNTGTRTGNLVLAADTCGSSAAVGSTGADPLTYPVCDKVTVALACTSPSTLSLAPAVLSAFTGATVGALAPGQATDCTFTVAVPLGTPSGYSSQVAAQALHWTLSAS